jgi:hypothetical protein
MKAYMLCGYNFKKVFKDFIETSNSLDPAGQAIDLTNPQDVPHAVKVKVIDDGKCEVEIEMTGNNLAKFIR